MIAAVSPACMPRSKSLAWCLSCSRLGRTGKWRSGITSLLLLHARGPLQRAKGGSFEPYFSRPEKSVKLSFRTRISGRGICFLCSLPHRLRWTQSFPRTGGVLRATARITHPGRGEMQPLRMIGNVVLLAQEGVHHAVGHKALAELHQFCQGCHTVARLRIRGFD